MQRVRWFEVIPEVFSDHQPIALTISYESSPGKVKVTPLVPKLNWNKQNKDVYRARVLEGLEDNKNNKWGSSMDNYEEAMNIIKNSASVVKKHVGRGGPVFKQPWFDFACYNQRKESMRLLKMCRKHYSPENMVKYQEANDEYKKICKKKEKAYYQSIDNDFASVNNAESFWKLIDKIKKKNIFRAPQMEVDVLVTYFRELLNPAPNGSQICFVEPFIEDYYLDRDFAYNELSAMIMKLKVNKAPGPDRITNEFFKNAPEALLHRLLGCYNWIYNEGKAPKSFTEAILFPLFKKGDTTDPSSFRGIAFMNSGAKILTGLMLERLSKWVDDRNILHEAQAGFRSGYSTADNLFTLFNVVSLRQSQNKKTYIFYVDLKAAFDRVERNALFYKLSSYGVSTKFCNLLRSLYENTRMGVWTAEGISEYFETHTGVKQGCLLSPMLFSLFLNDLPGILSGGVRVGDTKIKCLMYADDVAIVAENASSLKMMIRELEGYLDAWNLVLSKEKSMIMICGRHGGRRAKNETFLYKGKPLTLTNQYKYLGVIVTPSLDLGKHHKLKVDQAKYGLNSVWGALIRKRNVSFEVKHKVFLATIRSVIGYAAQIWGWKSFEQLERFNRYYLKKVFALPQNTPNYILYAESGVEPLEFYFMKLQMEYVVRTLKLPKHRYPRTVAEEVMKGEVSWFHAYRELAEKNGFAPASDLRQGRNLESHLQSIRESLVRGWKAEIERAVAESQHHTLYAQLDRNNKGGRKYLADTSLYNTRTIFRARSEMLSVNFRWWREGMVNCCSMCNLRESETTFHFLATCPALGEFRVAYLGTPRLSSQKLLEILNGSELLPAMVQFIRKAGKYRRFLTEEFNYTEEMK